MQTHFNYDQTFHQIQFKNALEKLTDSEACIFEQCDLENLDLSQLHFINCTFIECNLSNIKLNETSLQNCEFKRCKMIGFHVEHCNPFGLKLSFEQCLLNDSSFYGMQLQQTMFNDCQLIHVDFGYANLTQAYFGQCNLHQAIFDQTNLVKANLKTAYNFSINPTENNLKQAQFSKENCLGLLHHFKIIIE